VPEAHPIEVESLRAQRPRALCPQTLYPGEPLCSSHRPAYDIKK